MDANTAVPVNHLIESWAAEAERRGQLQSFLRNVLLLLTMMGVAIVFQFQTAFLQNTSALSNVLFFNLVRIPSTQVIIANHSLVATPWIGPLVAWNNISTLEQVLVYAQNMPTCSEAATACMYAPVLQQVRSQVFQDACSMWPHLGNGTQCQKTVFTNCLSDGLAGQFSGTLVPDPITLPAVNNMCGVTPGFGSHRDCAYQSNNWYTLTPQSAPMWLDNRTRNVIVSLGLFNPGAEIVQAFDLVMEQDLSGRAMPSVQSYAYTAVAYSSEYTGMMAFLVTLIIIDVLSFLYRAAKHPNKFKSWWVFYDVLLIAFLLGLLVQNCMLWSAGVVNLAGGYDESLNRPACEPNSLSTSMYLLAQWFGLVFALALVRLLKFTSLMTSSDVVSRAAVYAFDTLFFAAVLVFGVTLILAAALLWMFGAQTVFFSNYLTSFSAFISLSLGRDVGLIFHVLESPWAAGDGGPAATAFFVLILYIVLLAVSTTVAAVVAVTYLHAALVAREAAPLPRYLQTVSRVRKTRIPGCRFALSRFFRRVRFYLLGHKRYDLVGPDTVLERLVAWTALRDNVNKTFIAFEEVEDAVCRIDVGRRLRGLDARQVRDIMRSCGDMHVYTIEQAKTLEWGWERAIDASTPWVSRTAEDIALECNRVPRRTKEVEGKSVEAQQANVERALNQYDVAVANLRGSVLPLVKKVNEIVDVVQV